ncbi:aspartate-semialdehyde dehydrogenase [Brachyspira murdochii]|uniref:Aspartate-semialdehyde dehydrogenase n=1 Tax=Brachyspira murdochii (strain ATCC 51284 / DSM 12563 / 56-150) TaxID=526224 RepID=D5UAV9_BRAM5|nr:aspartate-semialdehyde dehydrogenase [Brachyspira murdochii]ADG71832.1 aspartate-semialdehyde dehydrogenase [Brachyspira murdochii DSM 12563]
MKKVNLCLLGASGAVGQEMLKVLEERKFPINELRLLGNREAGKKVVFNKKEYTIEKVTKDSFNNMDITLVAVGADLSKKLSPEAVKAGSIVVDNSSAFRMDKNVPLVVPEVNPDDVKLHKGIISNPNCSTIIALVALAPLHKFGKIKRIIASTYQAVSGAGKEGMEELEQQLQDYVAGNKLKNSTFKYQILHNLIPQIDSFDKNGYTKEELKMTNEGRKILHAPEMQISCTCVRVPVIRSHSEAITIETEKKITVKKARDLLSKAKGVKVVDDPEKFRYPMPLDTSDQDDIFVGRIREDISAKNSLVLWCAGDQIRKGAATNAVQIAELLLPELEKKGEEAPAKKTAAKRTCVRKKATKK